MSVAFICIVKCHYYIQVFLLRSIEDVCMIYMTICGRVSQNDSLNCITT